MALVEISVEAPLARLVLNRPELRNALSIEMCNEIVTGLERISETGEARVLVVAGNGSSFCAGADFSAVTATGGEEFVVAFERMLESLAHHRLPTIARLHGAALGGGLQLATACDFRLAASDASIGIPSSKLGILVNFENVVRLTLVTGIAIAKEVLMTGRTYSGAEAAAVGLVNRSVAPDALDAEVDALARDLAQRAPLSVQGSKRALGLIAQHLGAIRATMPEAAAEIDRLVAEAYASEDLAEGLRAMSEKRPPNFKGR